MTNEYFWMTEENFVEKELTWAALAYIRFYMAETQGDRDVARGYFPWDDSYWKPKNPRNCLETARALITKELERLNNVD